MDNYTNFDSYEYSEEEYIRLSRLLRRNRKKMWGIILMVLGAILSIGGIVAVFAAENLSIMETSEPIDVYYATESDQYSYALVQYMTESVVYFEAMENMQFYIVCDNEWNPAVVCLHSDEMSSYQPYIDWLYSESYEGGPEEIIVTGYAQPFDSELEQLIMQGFNDNFGEGVVDESNFTDWFGKYYLRVGQKNEAYNISKIGIYVLLVAVILMVAGGWMLHEKNLLEQIEYSGRIDEKSNIFMGILGAIIGATLGGLLWVVIGALGYIVIWLGILIVMFANTGYKMFEHRKETLGLVISVILSIIVVVPATYLTYAWTYYCTMNETIGGYVSLKRAIFDLPVYLTTYDKWTYFWGDLVLGYLFLIIGGGYLLIALIIKARENKL